MCFSSSPSSSTVFSRHRQSSCLSSHHKNNCTITRWNALVRSFVIQIIPPKQCVVIFLRLWTNSMDLWKIPQRINLRCVYVHLFILFTSIKCGNFYILTLYLNVHAKRCSNGGVVAVDIIIIGMCSLNESVESLAQKEALGRELLHSITLITISANKRQQMWGTIKNERFAFWTKTTPQAYVNRNV